MVIYKVVISMKLFYKFSCILYLSVCLLSNEIMKKCLTRVRERLTNSTYNHYP
jgi:hypothetical protein